MMKDWLAHRAGTAVSLFGNGINLSQSLHDLLRSQKDERLFIVDSLNLKIHQYTI
jgi:hypothetical protein